MDSFILEYLQSKGFTKTCAELQQEQYLHQKSHNTQTSSLSQEYLLYMENYNTFRYWLMNSLDLVREELLVCTFPIFVHCYIGLLRLDNNRAKEFWNLYSHDHRQYYEDELQAMSWTFSVTCKDDETSNLLQQSIFLQEVLKSKFIVKIRHFTFELLTTFLQYHNVKLISAIFNEKILFEFITGYDGSYIKAKLPNYHSDTESKSSLAPVNWGVPGTMSLIEKTPLFASMESYFLQAMPDTRNDPIYRTWIDPLAISNALYDKKNRSQTSNSLHNNTYTNANPLEPTILFATVTNSYEGMVSMHMTKDMKQVATGYQDSCVRLFRLDDSTFGDLLQNIESNNILPRAPYSHFHGTNANSKSSVLTLKGHQGPVFCIDQDNSSRSSGRFVISGSSDSMVKLWDTSISQCIASYSIDAPVWDVKFHPISSKHFLTANMDHTLHLYDIEHSNPIRLFLGHTSDVIGCSWHENNTLFTSISDDKTTRLWDLRTNSCVRIFHGTKGSLTCIASSPFGNMIATGTDNGNVYLHDIATSRSLAILNTSNDSSIIHCLAFSPDNQAISCGANDCAITTWSLMDLRPGLQSISRQSSSTIGMNTIEHEQVFIQYHKRYFTKCSPIYYLNYDMKSSNLIYSGGPFSLQVATGHASLDVSLSSASEKEAISALGLAHVVPS